MRCISTSRQVSTHLGVPGTESNRNAESNAKAAGVWSGYETVFTNEKAGMAGVDRDHVKRVVYEMSKDSAHFANEQRKIAATEQRIARMRGIAAALQPSNLASHTVSADQRIVELEAGRDLTRTWIHVDMDAFFAAVEELSNPALRGRPFAVGGIGMISTASYAARRYGVRSAMPGFIALKLCPELTFVRPDFQKYQAACCKTREVFARFDPLFDGGSLDEAYLDVTEYCATHSCTGAEVAERIREAVLEETGGLTCSCGIAPNRLLAKVCSDKNKPDGQFELPPVREAIMEFVASLPVRKVPGVGRVTEHVLHAFGVDRCCDVLRHRGLLRALFSPTSMNFFLQFGLGIGETRHAERPAEGEVGRKGISCEQTFRPMRDREALEAKVVELADHLAADMAEEGLKGKTLTLKLKLTTFEVRTRALTADRYFSSEEDIRSAALRLLQVELPVEIRLMGLRMSNFYERTRDPGQPSLEDILSKKRKKADEILEVHTSQVLSHGDEVELTLREWQGPADERHAKGLSDNNFEPEQGENNKHESTWACGACTYENLNTRTRWLCEMCGTSRSGRRLHKPPSTAMGPHAHAHFHEDQPRRKRGGSGAPPSIRRYCIPKNESPP